MLVIAALSVLWVPWLWASDPAMLASEAPDPEHIYGGEETDQCAWPTVAYLSTGSSACTGTLIHPQIVLTAAHCVPGNATATVVTL